MIRLRGLKKAFCSGDQVVNALKGIDLDIEKGEIFGIIGLSGAGKSTLIRMLNLLEVPTEGTVEIDGINLAALTPSALRDERKQIGMIFQHFNLLSSKTIFRNVAYPLEINKTSKSDMTNQVNEMLKLVDLEEKANAYPSMLSGGQKQRAAIARALVGNPKLLLCDEATSALDPKTTQDILSLLKEINQKLGITIVLITHEMSVIQTICDKVAVIDQGIIVEQGPVAEVFKNPKQEMTKILIEHLPRHLYTDDLFEGYKGNVIRLHFDEVTSKKPVVADTILQTGLKLNVLSSEIDEVSKRGIGSMIIEIPGCEEDKQNVISMFQSQGVKVEVIK